MFSEELYASPNKAIEELIANAFDAGARRTAVFLPAEQLTIESPLRRLKALEKCGWRGPSGLFVNKWYIDRERA